MRTHHLARRRYCAGWAHPYATGPLSPYWYADGGDGDGSQAGGDGSGTDPGEGADAPGSGGRDDQADATGSHSDSTTEKSVHARVPKSMGEDPAAQVARLTKELEAARKEAGKARTDAKRQAAEEAKASLVQELGRALGLVQDEKDTPPDPAKLTAEIERTTAAHRETAVELAVYKGAARHGADPAALTDSRAFLAKLHGLDPTADGFAKKVSDAIKQAVADNPKLAAAGPPPASASGEMTGGAGEPDSPATGNDIDQIRAARRKRRAG